jgi:tetratricopeptide (TPR) repeat protein
LTKRRLIDGTAGLEEGIKCFDDAISVAPFYHRAYYNQACYFALLGKPEQALENLKEAIKLAPLRCRERAKDDTDFASIREDARFKELVKQSLLSA